MWKLSRKIKYINVNSNDSIIKSFVVLIRIEQTMRKEIHLNKTENLVEKTTSMRHLHK